MATDTNHCHLILSIRHLVRTLFDSNTPCKEAYNNFVKDICHWQLL